MSKIRSLLILVTICFAVGIAWLAYASRSSATLVDGPNLSVRSDVLGSQWVVRDENILANACSAIEGEVTPALRKLVRFTVMTPNTGNQDIFVGDPTSTLRRTMVCLNLRPAITSLSFPPLCALRAG